MFGTRLTVVLLAGSLVGISEADEPAVRGGPKALQQFVEAHCLDCHDKVTKTGGLALDELIEADIGRNAEAWEKVVRKLTARQMPPKDAPRPKERDYDAAVALAGIVARRGRREAVRIRAAPRRSGGSTARSIRTRSATCWRWRSMSPRSCRRTSRATASTTSRSPISRRRC